MSERRPVGRGGGDSMGTGLDQIGQDLIRFVEGRRQASQECMCSGEVKYMCSRCAYQGMPCDH